MKKLKICLLLLIASGFAVKPGIIANTSVNL